MIEVPARGDRPRLSASALGRPDLYALLDGPAPLVVLRAVHGAGKTTALAAWDAHRGYASIWLRVRAGAAGEQELVGRIAGLVPSLRDAPEEARPSTWPQLFDAIESSTPAVLILDDAGHIPPQDARELVRALAHAPGIRLLVATDRTTFFETPAAALHVDRTVLGAEQLMFDRAEISGFLEVDDERAEELRRATGGLPAAIRAVAESERKSRGPLLTDAVADVVRDYLHLQFSHAAREDGFLAALARMSTADAVDPRTALALTGDPQVETILDEAAKLGLGSWSDAGLFAFTPLIRDFLQQELGRSYSIEVPELRWTAAREALRRNAPADALQLAVDAEDYALAGHVVLVSWHQLLEHHGLAVVDMLGSVPLSRLRDQPLVVMLLAICYLSRRVRRLRGLQLLRLAIASADSPRTALSPVERVYIWAAQSAALRLVGRARQSGDVAARALRRLIEMPESTWEPYANEIPLVCAHLGVSLFYAGLRRSAIEAWTFAAALAGSRGSRNALHSLALLAGVHALDGDMPEARHYAALIRSGDWPQAELDGYRGTFYRVAEALLALEDGDVEAAAHHVSAFGPHRETSEHWLVMTSVETQVLLHRGLADAGLERLESLVTARGREGSRAASRQSLSAARVHLHLARGSLAAATAVLDHDAEAGEFRTAVLAARLALHDGRPFDALRRLARTEGVAPNPRLRAEAAAITAAATLRTGGAAAAARPLRALAAVLQERELRTPLSYLPPSDLEALAHLLDEYGVAAPVGSSLFPAGPTLPRLSARERVVLQALHSGDAIPTIADALGVSVNTVKTQLRSLYRKLDVADRASAIARSQELGLLDVDA